MHDVYRDTTHTVNCPITLSNQNYNKILERD